jgi:prepilin-type N-terminal cleavage/methylation domain-containing protein
MRSRGFTLVELMVVVTMVAVLAVMAAASFRRARTENDVDAFANAIRTAIIQARRRAVATRYVNPYGYLVDLQRGSVRWCQIDPTTVDPNTLTSKQVTCTPPSTTPGVESGGLVPAGQDAQVSFYATQADVAALTITGVSTNSSALNTTYAAPTKIPLPAGGAQLYFGPSGTCDGNFNAAVSANRPLAGFTIYVQPIVPATESAFKRRRISTYGISARPRIIDKW